MKWLLGEKLELDWKVATIMIVSTLLLLIDRYSGSLLPWTRWFPGWDALSIPTKVLDRTILFLLVPLAIITLLFRGKLSENGLTLGDWKAGLLLSLAGILIFTPIIWLAVKGNTTLREYYKDLLPGLPWNTLLDLIGWEFLFRGWLLFGYARKFGSNALWMQSVPFALAHIGKPGLETISTIFGGFAFGWLGWRTKSFLYPLLVHWYVSSLTIFLAGGMLA